MVSIENLSENTFLKDESEFKGETFLNSAICGVVTSTNDRQIWHNVVGQTVSLLEPFTNRLPVE